MVTCKPNFACQDSNYYKINAKHILHSLVCKIGICQLLICKIQFGLFDPSRLSLARLLKRIKLERL